MLKAKGIRNLLEARVNEASGRLTGRQAELAGRARFLEDLREQLGLMVRRNPKDENSDLMESVDDFGRPVVAEGALKPEEFSIRELAEGICGQRWVESLNPSGSPDMMDLLEAGPAIDPTAFININTLSLATSGLLQAKMLEKFKNPEHIGDMLVTVNPTSKNGEKLIGTYGFQSTDGDNTRKTGMPHQRAQFGERWVTTPETVEKGLACEVYKETIFFDMTKEVLDRAGAVGEILAYGKEKSIIDGVIGAVNPYIYGGTGYNTYQTSTPWINSHDNALVDYDNIDKSVELARKMTDPETGREIEVNMNTVLHVPRRGTLWDQVLYPTQQRNITNTNTATYSGRPRVVRNPPTTIESQIYYNRLVASGVDATKALDYWFHGDFKGAFAWMENWPLTVRQASASEYAMLDRGIVFAVFGNHRGIFAVLEPRKAIRNIKA